MTYGDDDVDDVVEFPNSQIIRATDAAVLVKNEDGEQFWVPKSVVHDDSEIWDVTDGSPSEVGTLVTKAWWARKNDYA